MLGNTPSYEVGKPYNTPSRDAYGATFADAVPGTVRLCKLSNKGNCRSNQGNVKQYADK